MINHGIVEEIFILLSLRFKIEIKKYQNIDEIILWVINLKIKPERNYGRACLPMICDSVIDIDNVDADTNIIHSCLFISLPS
jgi:hypothetical protein